MRLPYLLTIIFLTIVLMILASNYFKVHPICALIFSCFFLGFAIGMDSLMIIMETISDFGGTWSALGSLRYLETIKGVFVKKSGALVSCSLTPSAIG